jgi:itaconate CoA-transferase
MNPMEIYRSKLTTPEKAAALIPDKSKLLLAFGPAIPPALCEATAKRADSGELTDIHLTYMHSTEALANTLLREDLLHIFHPKAPYMGVAERSIRDHDVESKTKRWRYLAAYFHKIPEIFIHHIGFDTFLLQVSPMDRHGYFSVGICHDYGAEMIHHVPRIMVEVNENMPRTHGDGFLHVSQVAAVVEHSSPLPEFPLKAPAEVDRRIAAHIAEMVPDRATVQFGVGSVPDAVCEALQNHRDLGVHSELISPALAKLIQSGAVTNRYKALNRHKSLFTVMLADRATYDFVDDNPAVEGYSVSYVNDPAVISRHDNLISVNGIMQVDFTGQANAEMVGMRQFSGVGGQTDFIRGARASKGGKSILATRSTAKGETVSKIVPFIQDAVTDTRMDTQYVVTEYGVADLLGKSTTERALALIKIAHPKFQEDLLRAAKEMGAVA